MERANHGDDTKTRIERTDGLARLGLDEEDFRLLAGQIDRVLEAFGKIDALEAAYTKPAVHPVPAPGPLRDDSPGPSLQRAELMANTEHDKDGFFSVKRVIG